MTEQQVDELLRMLWLLLCVGIVAVVALLCLAIRSAWEDLLEHRRDGQVPPLRNPPAPLSGYQPRGNVPPGEFPSEPPRHP